MDTSRRHDLDALRVFAFALLILYHASMAYVAEWPFALKSVHLAEWLQWPMIALNRWRMPLLFMISGMAISLARPRRAPWMFAWSRTRRLLIPLVFGMFVVVSVQAYCQGVNNGMVQPGFGHFLLRYWQVKPWPPGSFDGAEFGITWMHLWYLAYLWPYTLLLLTGAGPWQWLGRRFRFNVNIPDGLLQGALVVLPILWGVFCLQYMLPRYPPSHALAGDWFVHAESFPLFVLGYLLAGSDRFWNEVLRWRWLTLTVALLAITMELAIRAAGRYLPPGHIAPAVAALPWPLIEHTARASYTWTALLALFGWGRVLLDRPFRWLGYCNEAVLPWYMLHQSLIVLILYWLIPLHLGPWLEPTLVIGGTIAGCLLLHECLIRRIGWLRLLFGLKPRKPLASPATTAPSPIAS